MVVRGMRIFQQLEEMVQNEWMEVAAKMKAKQTEQRNGESLAG